MEAVNRRRTELSLLNKLRLPIVASVVLVLLVVGFALIQISRRTLTRQIFRVQEETAKEISLSISYYLQRIKGDLVTLSQAQNWKSLDQDEKRWVLERVWKQNQQNYEEIVYLDRFGDEVAKVSNFYVHERDELGSQTRNPAFQRAVAGEDYLADAITISPNSALPVVEVAVPVRDPDTGNSLGVLLAKASIVQMWNRVAEVKVGESGYVYVVNKLGRLQAHSNFEDYQELQGESLKSVSAVRQITSRVEEFRTSLYTGLTNERVVGAAAPIEETYWFTIVELPVAEAYASLRRLTVFLLGILVITGLALAGLISWLPQRVVRSPLNRLQEGAILLRSGDLSHRIALHTGDELETLANTFNQMAVRMQELYAGLEHKVEERTRDLERRAAELEAAAEVARDAAAIRDVNQLLDEVVHLISDQFGFYHAGIFLLDDAEEYAVLRAANSPGGQRMLSRGHKLAVGEVGIVGYVSGSGEPRIALDVGEDAVYFDNPDLPETRSEMGLPLKIRERVIGVLDVQSIEAKAFTDQDVAILQTMADQLALAIDNARLLEESQRTVRELRIAQGEQVRTTWGSMDRVPAFEYDRIGVKAVDANPVPIVNQALSKGEVVPVTQPDNGHSALVVPLRLRDQVIGNFTLEETDQARTWTEDEIGLVKEVSEQVALALENARLFEEAQIRAEELAVLNELAQALSARFNVDEVLEEAHRGASRLISAENFYVGLYDPEAEQITIRFNSAEARADRQITTLDVDQGLTGYVIRNRRPLLIKHNVQKRMTELGVELVGEPARSWLGVPLMVGDRVLGMMAIQSYDESHLYDEHDQGLLTAIASQTAIALQSADLFEQTEQRARRERLIREVTTKIVGSTDLDTVLQTTAQELGKVLGTSRAVVRLSTSSDVDGQEDEVEGPTDG